MQRRSGGSRDRGAARSAETKSSWIDITSDTMNPWKSPGFVPSVMLSSRAQREGDSLRIRRWSDVVVFIGLDPNVFAAVVDNGTNTENACEG